MDKFNLLIFIDDDEAINFIHKIVVKKAGNCEKYLFFQKAQDALEYFRSLDGEEQVPDAIFLDINMPAMDGWEFLEAYEKINLPKSPVVIMLTTSLRPLDRQKGEENPLVYKFINKPLTIEHLFELSDELLTEEDEAGADESE